MGRLTRPAAIVASALAVAAVTSVPASGHAVQSREFGHDGFVTWRSSSAHRVVVQPNGGIVVSDGPTVLRFAANGSRDTRFTIDAVADVRTRLGHPVLCAECATGLAVDAAGRLLVSYGEALVRLLPDGALDRSFASDGVATFPGLELGPVAVVPNGDIVVSAWAAVPGQSGQWQGGRLIELRPDGSVDTTFGNLGVAKLRIAAEAVASIHVDPRGRLILVATTPPGTSSTISVQRYRSDGTFETTLGDSLGLSTSPPELVSVVVALQRDGKILIGGSQWPHASLYNAVIGRFLDDGTPDPAFGVAGVAATGHLPAGCRDGVGPGNVPGPCLIPSMAALVVQPRGDIVFTGDGTIPSAFSGKGTSWLVQRFTPDGRLRAEAGAGPDIVDGGADCWSDWGEDAALQPDGKVVVVGSSTCGTAAIARYGDGLRLEGEQSLRLRLAPGRAPVMRAQRWGGYWTMSTRLDIGAGARIEAFMRRAHRRADGTVLPYGRPVRLIEPAGSGGRVTTRFDTAIAHEGAFPIRVFVTDPVLRPRTWYAFTVSAIDKRGRHATVTVPVAPRP